jgi:predicted TIM-barrel fold metal-dependent hydrolase
VSRQFDRSPLPPLRNVLKEFSGFSRDQNKLRRIIEILRGVILELRQKKNVPFYSMREVAAFVELPLRTVAMAFQQLEADGLLLRIRGSHTKILGLENASISHVSGVVGIPVWLGGISYYEHRRRYFRTLAEALWKNQLANDIVFSWDYEDFSNAFIDRLRRHQFDYLVWFQPFSSHRNVIESMKDQGIRSVIISDVELSFMPTHIHVDWCRAYREILQVWKEKHRINQIGLVEPPPQMLKRIGVFETEAKKIGIDCIYLKQALDIFAHSKKVKQSNRTAFVLLDQVAPLQVIFRDPAEFIKTALRHRILFGRDCPNIPFRVPASLSVDRIVHPITEIVEHVAHTIADWRMGSLDGKSLTLLADAEIGVVIANSPFLNSLLPEGWK